MAENGSPIDPPDPALALKKRARRRLVGAIALALLAAIVLPMVMDQEPQPLTQDIQIRIPSQDPGTSAFVSRIAPKLAPTPTPLPQDAGRVAETSPAPSATPTTTPAPTPAPAPEPPAATKPAPASPVQATPAATPSPAAKPPQAAAEKKPAAKPAKGATTTATTGAASAPAPDKAAESARAAALLNDEHWIVQLGAYRSTDTVHSISARIKALGLPVFTEKVDTPHGPSTRVRSGPFASRGAAGTAQEHLKKNGIGAPPGGVVAQLQ